MKAKFIMIFALAGAALALGYGYQDKLEAALGHSGPKILAGKTGAPQSQTSLRRGRRRGSAEVPVLVGRVLSKPAPRKLTVIGSARAYSTVSIKSRVDGQITKVFFKEGQVVTKGEQLFRIDPRPFEVALRQAQANLERDRALANKAKGDLARYSSLVGKGFASRQKYDEARAAYDALKGTLEADEAAIQAAKLQLQYTLIRSPIDGATGSLLVNSGNLVKANDTQALVVVNQLRPIYVAFSVPERYLSTIKRLMAAGPVPVEAIVPHSTAAPASGRLAFVNNAVDTNTGTILLKAEFPNTGNEFTPGQFVNVALTLDRRSNALVVPSSALQEGQNGSFVYVLKTDKTVEMRNVVVADQVGNETVIAKGLTEGETVVLDGQLLLRPGAKVVPKTAGAIPFMADRETDRGKKRRKRN